MDAGAADLAVAIGLRIKTERQARGWTLDRLAETSGVSRRMLVNVEQGTVNPSVGTLLRLVDAMGIGLPALVEPPAPRPLNVVRRGEGAALWTSDAGGRGVLVAGTEPPDVVELWDWTLGPGDHHGSEPHAPGTRELLQVLEGTVVIEVGVQSLSLCTGDAVAFAGDLRHSYRNPDEVAARFSLAVFDPGVGAPAQPSRRSGALRS